jgi:EF hand domain-containing protein
MWRYWVGALAALVLVVGGVSYWRSTAAAKHGLPSAPQAIADKSGDGEDIDTPPQPPAADDKTREEKRFSRADHDKNGMVSRDEFLVARRRNFAKLDINNDGVLSFDEYAAKAEDKFAKADADHSGGLNPKEFATTKVERKSKPGCSCQKQDGRKGDDNE